MVRYDISKLKRENYITTKNWVKMDLSSELDNMIEKLKPRVEREIPDRGYFKDFSETLPKVEIPDFYGKNLALFIERDEAREGRAYLGVSVLHPTMAMDASSYIMNGDRNRILEYINDTGFKTEVLNTVKDLSDSLKNVR